MATYYCINAGINKGKDFDRFLGFIGNSKYEKYQREIFNPYLKFNWNKTEIETVYFKGLNIWDSKDVYKTIHLLFEIDESLGISCTVETIIKWLKEQPQSLVIFIKDLETIQIRTKKELLEEYFIKL